MHARIFLLTLGLLSLFAPGCCLLHHSCGSGCGSGCGCGCGLLGCINKIRDKIHNCSLCKSHSCAGDCGCSCGSGGMMMGDMSMSMADCGCGGGMPAVGGGGCGCGVAGGHGGHHEGTFMTPPMTVPSMSPAPPVPSTGVTMPPAIPPSESGSITPVPQGTQQVSVEEFQRLPGVIISGPGSQTAAAPTQQMAAQPVMTAPTTIAAPTSAARPIQQASATTVAPTNAKQVQQTGWAPVRQ